MARQTAPIPRQIAVQAIADASGVATVRFDGPGGSFDVLDVEVISLDCNSAGVPEARLYRGDPSAGQLIAVNPDGLTGQFLTAGAANRIESGRVWFLRWTGCTPGAVCNAVLAGTERRR